MYFNIEVMYQI